MSLGFSELSDGFEKFAASAAQQAQTASAGLQGQASQFAAGLQGQASQFAAGLQGQAASLQGQAAQIAEGLQGQAEAITGSLSDTVEQFTDQFASFQGDLSNLGNAALNIGNLNYDYDQAFSSLGNVVSNFNPSMTRLAQAGLASFGKSLLGSTTKSAMSWANGNNIAAAGVNGDDWRIRISVGANASILYNNSSNALLSPIRDTMGVIFPITPNLQITNNAKYSPQSLTHSNYEAFFYEGSSVASIMLAGEFPIQNIEEGQYLLAAIYFFRSVTKMFFGADGDTLAGTPPPMVFLNGYGGDYFPDVPCVVTSFMHTMPEGVDYIEVPPVRGANGAPTRLPTQSTLQVTLQPVYSRSKVHRFSLEDFANGSNLQGVQGFI